MEGRDLSRKNPPIRVVLADDHPIFIDAVQRLLASEPGFEVVAHASDGGQVLDLLRQHQPDIILLDIRMPGVDGLQALKSIQQENLSSKVIILSASEDRYDFVRAKEYGARGIVPKQAATHVLLKCIRAVLKGEFWFGEEWLRAGVMAGPAAGPEALSGREWQVAELVTRGLRNRDIAGELGISEQTVKNHLRRMFEKLEVSDRVELALRIVRYKSRQR